MVLAKCQDVDLQSGSFRIWEGLEAKLSTWAPLQLSGAETAENETTGRGTHRLLSPPDTNQRNFTPGI